MADIPALVQVGRPITLLPVGLKEAALDSPTFRSGFTHFSEQFDLVEKWLEGYVKCTSRLSHEVANFESLVSGFLTQTTPPTYLSEAVIDHDYTLLAMKRYGEGAKESWTATMSGLRKIQVNIVEPIRTFLLTDLRSFKELRRNLHVTQKELDNLHSRYSGQAKTKEASSLREDAFQLHEARKAYLKASMDFSVTAPQLRMALDKMLVKVFADQWRDMRTPRQNISGSIGKWGSDIERVRGWSREMENGEKAFRRELQTARKQIEESAEAASRPSRELEDYAVGSASASAVRAPSTTNLQTPGGRPRSARSEKQGWLNLRTVSGKPSRTTWLRKWFFVKNGIFGWLVQGTRSGGVEESERIGLLLCNVKPGNADDRRYVFEVKTKDTTIVVQAETAPELVEWLATFEIAKQKALEDPASTESPGLGPRAQDPAFAISPPSAPEFAASAADSGMPQHTDDNSGTSGLDRSSTLPVPGGDLSANRSSFDVTSHRRSFNEREVDVSRDPASRIIQRLDLHRKPLGSDKSAGSLASPGLSGGGIASLIAASHTSMPVGPGALPTPPPIETPVSRKSSASILSMRDLPMSTLAPNTLANPPAPTNLSAAAVIVNGEKGIGVGRIDASGGMPSGLMANIWGSANWGHLNRLERGEVKSPQEKPMKLSDPPSPMARPSNASSASGSPLHNAAALGASDSASGSIGLDKTTGMPSAPSPSHRKTISLGGDEKNDSSQLDYPNYYPLQLKMQDAQFRLLFPNVRRDERLVLVFKATWSPNEQQEFPGRIFVTAKEIYFYSNHCGLTLITGVGLDSISEITAATGKECDFVFCHMKNNNNQTTGYNRITIKTFIEPLSLLQRRLNFLVRNRTSQGIGIEEIMKTLIKMEQDDPESSPSIDSWENVSINTPTDGDSTPRRNASHRDQRDLRASVFIDRGLYGSSALQLDSAGDSSKAFKLPKQPITYAPSGMDKLVLERNWDISPKALFHIMFGDKSVVWQLLYHERRARHIKQKPWSNQLEHGYLRRDFEYQIEYLDILRRVRIATVEDHQMVEVANEHLLYVISDRKRPWHLPHRDSFLLLTKVVITHLAKSKCKLAVYTKVEWTRAPPLMKGIVAEAALKELELDALDLADVIADQVRNFASAHGRTKKAIQIFGSVGLQTQVSLFAGNDAPFKAQLRRKMGRRTLTALAFESLGSLLESVATSAVQIVFDLVRWTWKTIDANSVLLAILATSVFVNVIFSSTGTSEWCRERKAGNFMTRLGVGPDLTMSKAVYLHEIHDFSALELDLREASSSHCRDTFSSVMNLGNNYAHQHSQQLPSMRPSQTPAARRLQRSREHLGFQRHDLLVAMRVINNIEREMLQAEWENWLLEETVKCKHLGVMLSHNTTGKNNNGRHVLDGESRRLEEARAWQKQYCDSCNKELETVVI